MNHLIASVRHGVYVYAVALVGALGATQASEVDLSTSHSATLALYPAAAGALYQVASKTVRPVLVALAKAILADASAAPAAPVAPVPVPVSVPSASAQDVVNP